MPTPFAIISFWETYRGAAHSGKRWNVEGSEPEGRCLLREQERQEERRDEAEEIEVRGEDDRGGRAVRGNVNWGDLLRN